MPYKVVLVDDEPWALVYLKKIFKWESMGFEVIAETCNSVDALDIIIEKSPDVVLTDIRMPKISGIELMKEARARGNQSIFIIVSGFAEFSYAQEAIKLGAFEYCLKPLSSQKADELLNRLTETLKRKNSVSGETDRDEDDILTELYGNELINPNFLKMLEYIKANYDRKLRLKELAERFYLHPNYCCNLFSKVLNKTFSEYLTDLRMKKAEELIRRKHLTIKQVARKVGFDDYFYFNKVFKKYYGLTPGQYKEKYSDTGCGLC